jgi:D-tyrosyl-tRNA(Tyr) deacylase
MRAVLQRVSQAQVEVDGEVTGRIGLGLLVLLGVEKGDTEKDAAWLVEKTIGLRVFPDDAGRMNRGLMDVGGSLLVVSQFTLLGDCRKGRRPSFDQAAPPADAVRLYDEFVAGARARGVAVETGVFQAHMQVSLTNSGPVTLLCESRPQSVRDTG